MAVVQISRIQVRRGKANSGTGIPQLASGEIAWALDTQELYIGNGSVSEGAPAVGNTKILTELDLNVNGNILNLLQYIYKVAENGMQTGDSPNTPVTRTIQGRLDDHAIVTDFGAVGDGVTDDTAAIQRAIDQLFLNTVRGKASDTSVDGIKNRVLLEMPPGKFLISSTLYIPSYASLIGAGDDKTILYFTGTGSAVKFVNDSSTPGSPSPLSSTQGITQPRSIILKGLTIQTINNTQTGLQVDATKDSVFENLSINGMWGGVYNANNKGIAINVVSAIVTSELNIFRDITIRGFSYAVYSKQDILNNTFRDIYVNNCRQGIVFGLDANTNTIGQQYGPRGNFITNCRFEDVKRHGVYIDVGVNNTIQNCRFINVGNNGSGNVQATYPQIYITNVGNSVENNQSDRADDLANPDSGFLAVPYVPEVAGHAVYKSFGTRVIPIGPYSGYGLAFRLPLSTDDQGDPWRDISYSIDYLYRSYSNKFSRRGNLKLLVDVDASTGLSTPVLQLTDDYEFAGSDPATNSLAVDFRARLLNIDGTYYTGGVGEIPYSVAIEYATTLSGVSDVLHYSYTATF